MFPHLKYGENDSYYPTQLRGLIDIVISFSAHLQISVSDMIKNSVIKVDPVKGSTFVVVMDKDTTQAKLYEHYLSFFLPEGMLNFFELVWMETESLTSRESQKDLAYTGVLHILLD